MNNTVINKNNKLQRELEARVKNNMKLVVIILLSDDGLKAGNNLGYSDFEIYCIMNVAKDFFIESESYEICADIRKYLCNPEMIHIESNITDYTEEWKRTKKIF